MHPSIHARELPGKPAVIEARTGVLRTYAEMEAAADRGAQLIRSIGLRAGDAMAIWLDNRAEYFDICWAAHRAGLYFVPISTHLTAAEAAHIVRDGGAQLLVVGAGVGPEVPRLLADRGGMVPAVQHVFSVGDALPGLSGWTEAAAAMPAAGIADETAGAPMFYSSGTTGVPKGVRMPLSGGPAVAEHPLTAMTRIQFGGDADMVSLIPAPLYHTAPLSFAMSVHRVGGTNVIMGRFDPEGFLDAVQRYRVTHTQVVPTMLVRLLKLPAAVRQRYDLSSLRYLIHAAAPCPIEIKQQVIDWLGPVVYEYYGGTESIGATFITSADWLTHRGSVGKASWGQLHICDEAGDELPPGRTGIVYFSGVADFQYHGDPEKSRRVRNPRHPDWATLGDLGHVDAQGYLYLTDRRDFTIISGGVNIYPQEAENVLITHPKVADVAVFGVPNEEFGEEVKAVVQPLHWEEVSEALAAELMAFCRDRLAAIKCPRSIDFEPQLPRQDNGKLYKRKLRERYWPGGVGRPA